MLLAYKHKMHILNNRHEYGPTNSTMDLLQPCEKGTRLNGWENYYTEEYQVKGQLFKEQCTQEVNTLYQLAQVYAPSNGTSRPDETANHASTYKRGVT
jgi:hypothetical protein